MGHFPVASKSKRFRFFVCMWIHHKRVERLSFFPKIGSILRPRLKYFGMWLHYIVYEANLHFSVGFIVLSNRLNSVALRDQTIFNLFWSMLECGNSFLSMKKMYVCLCVSSILKWSKFSFPWSNNSLSLVNYIHNLQIRSLLVSYEVYLQLLFNLRKIVLLSLEVRDQRGTFSCCV